MCGLWICETVDACSGLIWNEPICEKGGRIMKIRFCFLLLLVLLIPCLSASAEEMHYDPGFYTLSPDHLVYEPEPELVKPSSYEPTSYTYSSGYVIPDEGFRTYIPEESGASSDDSSESPVRRPETVRKAQDMEGTAKILKDRVM
jgi:hypothetical protein